MKIRRSVISLISDTECIVFSGLNKIVDHYSCLGEYVMPNDFYVGKRNVLSIKMTIDIYEFNKNLLTFMARKPFKKFECKYFIWIFCSNSILSYKLKSISF